MELGGWVVTLVDEWLGDGWVSGYLVGSCLIR